MTTITICTTCRRDKTNEDPLRDGMRLLRLLDKTVSERGLGADVTLRAVACLSSCERACAAQISDDGRFTYALAELGPTQEDADDLLTFAASHAEKPKGLVIKSQRPDAIRNKVVARVPPADLAEFPLVEDWKPAGDLDG